MEKTLDAVVVPMDCGWSDVGSWSALWEIENKDNNGNVVRKCQLCETGSLSLKNSFRGGAFIGCSNYPECKFTRPLSKKDNHFRHYSSMDEL